MCSSPLSCPRELWTSGRSCKLLSAGQSKVYLRTGERERVVTEGLNFSKEASRK